MLVKALELLLGTLCFGCFAWGTLWHFRWEANGSKGAWAISLLSWAGYLTFMWQAAMAAPRSGWQIACVLMLGAFLLWLWTVRVTRANPPTLAYTQDTPVTIFQAGPYGWVRHPFYTAYMVFWFAAALADAAWLSWLICIALGAIYFAAARHEECKFARSDHAAAYQRYAAHAGMFFPRVLKG
jgi:protein-S-isoprenylcysteine O-methyltransferase Ste14